MKRLALLAVVVAAVVGTGAALAGTHVATTARLVGVTSPARRNADASLIARVSPARRCTIAVLYKTGPSHAQGLGPKLPVRGFVIWKWRVGGNTMLGTRPIQVNCGSAGSFRTHFKVVR